MTAAEYEKISAPFRKRKYGVLILNLINRILTMTTYFAYPVLLIVMVLWGDHRIFGATVIPAGSFVLFSVVRRLINAKRPYEVLEIKPLIHKNSKGKSFPSRHVFSIFVIAMTFLHVCLPLGIVFLVFGILLALIRVIGGVHFPRDVIVGALIGILCGLSEWILFV
ncbi:MAG: phosphatase PAP2 family protein [Eubacteriales bacterium]